MTEFEPILPDWAKVLLLTLALYVVMWGLAQVDNGFRIWWEAVGNTSAVDR